MVGDEAYHLIHTRCGVGIGEQAFVYHQPRVALLAKLIVVTAVAGVDYHVLGIAREVHGHRLVDIVSVLLNLHLCGGLCSLFLAVASRESHSGEHHEYCRF